MTKMLKHSEDLNDWVDALESLILFNGRKETAEILKEFISHAENKGLIDNYLNKPPFINSIPSDEEVEYPGDWDIEEKIRHYIRWNALVTVLKANKDIDLGGHISTYSSAATLYEVGFNHFFKGSDDN